MSSFFFCEEVVDDLILYRSNLACIYTEVYVIVNIAIVFYHKQLGHWVVLIVP